MTTFTAFTGFTFTQTKAADIIIIITAISTISNGYAPLSEKLYTHKIQMKIS